VKALVNNNVVTISEASMKPKITKKIVEIITPAFHTQLLPLHVS